MDYGTQIFLLGWLRKMGLEMHSFIDVRLSLS